jgi:glycosyltransferase involved in cell wall biosynthesis
MSNKPSVSVVIPTYNYAQFLSIAIDSALAQTCVPLEVIVVDDGSTDETPRVLERYRGQIQVIRKSNGGLAAARNSGVAASRGQWIAFLDSDDCWLPEKLDRQLARAALDSNVGLVHCGALEVDSEGQVVRERLDGLEGAVAAEMLLFRRTVVLLAGSTMIVRRNVFDEVGGFDEHLRHSEDWDFCYRVALGHKIAFVKQALVRYRLHATNMHKNVAAMEAAMMSAYQKAFSNAPPELRRLRRRAYGRLHTVLAGSYFARGELSRFLRHALMGVFLTPENLSRFLMYPVRRLIGRRSL